MDQQNLAKSEIRARESEPLPTITLSQSIEWFELLLALVLCSFLSFAVVGIGGAICLLGAWLENWGHLELRARVLFTVGYFLLLYLQFRTTRVLHDALVGPSARGAVGAALGKRESTLIMRVPVALWMLANAVAMIGLGYYVTSNMYFVHPTLTERVLELAAPPVIHFAAAYATNVFALITVGRITQSENLVKSLWRFRILFDLLITAVLTYMRQGSSTFASFWLY